MSGFESEINVNGLPALQGFVTQTEANTWRFVCVLDVGDGPAPKPGDPAKLSFGPGFEPFVGEVRLAIVDEGKCHLTVFSCESRKDVPARHYRGVTLQHILEDILRAPGLTPTAAKLSPRCDTAILQQRVKHYLLMQGDHIRCLNDLTRHLGAGWRHERDGSVLVMGALALRGEDEQTRPAQPTRHEAEIVSANRDLFVLEAEGPALYPGWAQEGRVYTEIRTIWDETKLRIIAFHRDDQGLYSDPASMEPERIERDTIGRDLSQRFWPAVITAQDARGLVDLMPDDPEVRGEGVQGVPLRHGIPGVSVKVKPGERAALFFEGGDPQRPACALWPDGSSVLEVAVKSDVKITVEAPQVIVDSQNISLTGAAAADHVAIAELVTDKINEIVRAISSATPVPMDGGAGLKTAILAYLASNQMVPLFPEAISSTKVKVS